MKSRVLAVGVLATLAAGCGPAGTGGAGLGQLRQDIIGGALDNGDPSVVAVAQVYHQNGGVEFGAFCSGTLVGSRTVVTAGHCVDHSLDGAMGGTPSIVAVVGADSNNPQQWRYITLQVQHPNYDDQNITNDVSVMKLESAFTGLTPLPVNSTPLTQADIGKTIRHVGFGLYGAPDPSNPNANWDGLKREVSYGVRQVAPKQVESGTNGKQTCEGDSGGPGFMVINGVEQLVGIVSYGDQQCAYEGWDTRADAYYGWITTTMAQWEQPSCGADGQCVQGCASPDVDCVCVADGQCSPACPSPAMDPDCPKDCGAGDVCSTAQCPAPDPDCVAVGDECARNQDCTTRSCVTDGQNGWYCTKGCSADADCPQDMTCQSSQCRFPLKPVKPLGEVCNAATDYCAGDSVCTGAAGAETRCRVECGAGFSCTEAGAACISGQGGVLFCQPPPPAPKTLPVAALAAGPVAAGCASAGGPQAWTLALMLLPWLLRRKVAVAAAAVTLAACAPSTDAGGELAGPSELGRKKGAIVGGTTVPQGQDPEVFQLVMMYTGGSCSSQAQCGTDGAQCYQGQCVAQAGCSATLIASRTLLTAAHCVDVRMGPTGAQKSVTIYATNYSDPNNAPQSAWFQVVKSQYHPNWNPGTNQQNLAGDVGLALLDRAPQVMPKAWNATTNISSYDGQPLRAVGYGTTGPNDTSPNTLKRQVALTFIFDPQAGAAIYYLGDQSSHGICHGDSGGPSFHTFGDGVERIVGVHSFTANTACTIGGDSRTDYYAPFINQWLTANEGPQCTRDGQCKNGCAPVDPDCVCVADSTCSAQCINPDWDPDCPPHCGQDGVCQPMGCPAADPDCVQLGGHCTTADVCMEKVCTLDQQHPDYYCSRTCQGDAQCPADMRCDSGTCKYVQLPEASLNAACVPGVNVCSLGLVCNGQAGDPGKRCLPPCTKSTDCMGGVACVTGTSGNMCDMPRPSPVTLSLAPRELPAAGCTAAGAAPSLLALWSLLAFRPRRRSGR